MQSFRTYLETTGVAAPPNIITPVDYGGDNGKDDDHWVPGMENGIMKWAESNSPCYKKAISALAEQLFDSEPIINMNYKVVSYDGGMSSIKYEWQLPLNNISFDLYEQKLKIILRSNCDLWKYINCKNVWNATDDATFMILLFYYFCTSGNTSEYLDNQAKFTAFNLDKIHYKEMVQEFVDNYNNRFHKQPKQIDDFKIRKSPTSSQSLLTGTGALHQKVLWAIADSRYTFDLPR